MNTGSPTARRRTQLAGLMTLALLAAAALAVPGPISQWASYHQFADARARGAEAQGLERGRGAAGRTRQLR